MFVIVLYCSVASQRGWHAVFAVVGLQSSCGLCI